MKIRFDRPESQVADVRDGIRVPYAPARRAFPRWRWYLVVLIVTSPLLFFLFKIGLGSLAANSPGVVSLEPIAVNSPRPAVVERVAVVPGQTVEAGEVLLRLDDPTRESLLALLEAERQVLQNRPRPSPGAAWRGQLALVDETVAYERARLETIRRLYEKGAATRAEVDEASGRLQRARADRISLEAAREGAGLSGDDDRARLRLAQIEAEMASIATTRGPLVLTSPRAAQVLDVLVGPGESVGQGTPLVRLADGERASFTAFVDADDRRFVEPEAEVTVRLPGRKTVKATVDGLPQLAQPMPASLAGPLSVGSPALKVRLLPREPLAAEDRIEGLPVTVHWGLRLTWPWPPRKE